MNETDPESSERRHHWVWQLSDVEFVTPLHTLSRCFVEGIKARNKIDLSKRQAWFPGAFSTMQRTQRNGPATFEQKAALERLLWDFVSITITRASFDDHFRTLLDDIGKRAPSLTLGQRQKLASIFLKYAFTATHGGSDFQHTPERLVRDCGASFPVPIDAVALHHLNKLRVETVSPKITSGMILSRGKTLYWARIQQLDDEWVPWSRLTCDKTYASLQQEIRTLAEAEASIPLEYEMRKLWPTRPLT